MNDFTRFITISVLFFTHLDCYSQNNPCQTYEYQKRYWNDVSNHVNGIINTSDGGNLIVGYYNPLDIRVMPDALIFKIDARGNVVWAKKAGTSERDHFMNAIETADGGYLAIGQTQASGTGTIISKFSVTGNLLWTKLYPTFSFILNHKLDVVELPTGGFAISCVNGSPISKATILRIDNAGNVTWAKSYSNSLSTVSMSNRIGVENDSLVVYGYYETGSLPPEHHRFLMKVGITDGNVFWAKRWSNAGVDLFRDLFIKNGLYYTNSRSGSNDYISAFKADGTLVNSFGLTSAIIDNEIDNFFPTHDTGIIIPKIDLSWNSLNLVKVKGTQVTDTKSFRFQPFEMASYPKTVHTLNDELVTVLGVTFIDYMDICIIKTRLTSSVGACPSNPVSISASPANISLVPFSWNNVMTENIAPSNLSLMVADVVFGGNTQCSTPITGCSQATISGIDTVCRSQAAFFYRVFRDVNCTSPVFFSTDSSMAQVIAQTDSTISLVFLQEGQTKLYSQITTACAVIRDSITITIKKHAGSLSLGSDQTVCGNIDFTFDAGSGFKSYLWQNGSANQTFRATAAGVYHVTVTDFCNNMHTDTVVVTADAAGAFDLGPDRFICPGDSTTLSAPAGFNNYQWSPGYNLISNDSTALVFPLTTTKYFVSAERSPGCFSTDSAWVYVYNTPSISLGPDTSFCHGDSKTLIAGPGFTHYQWNTGANTSQIVVSSAGQYSVIATDSTGCMAKDTLSVPEIYPLPLVSLSNDSTLCLGEQRILDAGGGPVAYLWPDGSTNQTLTVRDLGVYWVRVTSANNCNAYDTTRITIIKPAPADFLVADTSFCRGTTLILKTTQLFDNYLWSTGATTNTINISIPGTYWLEATNIAGCRSKEFSIITMEDCLNRIKFPNAFTPNNDGLNDLFKASVTGVLNNYSLVVYNRYGQLVFSTKDYTVGWDGLLKGREQNTGSFTWFSTYEFLNEKPASLKGTILLLR